MVGMGRVAAGLAVLALDVAAAQTPPPLPPLPSQYDVWITANIANKNYSISIHEIYDYPGNRILISQYHPGTDPGDSDVGMAMDLYLVDYNELLHRNSSGCFGSRLDGRPQGGGPPIGPGHIPASKDFLYFNNSGFEQVYQGRKRVNGVLCDHWISDQSNVSRGSMMYLDYYFTSADSWREAGIANTSFRSVPYMLNLTGSRPDINYTTGMPTGRRHEFNHFYVYHNWRIGPPQGHHNHDVFTIPDSMDCTGNFTFVPRSSNRHNDTKYITEDNDDKDNVLQTIGFCAASFIVGGVIAITVLRFNSQKTTTESPTFTNPAASIQLAQQTVGGVTLQRDSATYEDDDEDSKI